MALATSRSRAPSDAPLLRVEDLSVSYGRLRALDGVGLEIRPGEVVALAGENGAGKSTLVRCIAGDIAADRGRISLAGRRVSASPRAVARNGVAVVWQDLALCDNLDVAANLFLGRERGPFLVSATRAHQAAAALLRDLGIPLADTTRQVGSLSGGQRQMVAVARAMRDRPKLLILDEPTAALGVQESAQVEELTFNLRRQGTTILLVSHDIDQLFRLTDRIVVLRLGRVVADVDPSTSHPDEVVALLSGQAVDASARRQLSRLQGLADQLTSADPSSSLSLILSALGAALGTDQVCIHLLEGGRLRARGMLGVPGELARAWHDLPMGAEGGPAGMAAASGQAVVDDDVRASRSWAPFIDLARSTRIGSSWAVPVTGTAGLAGVITVFRRGAGRPERDELELVTLYASYAASAIERDRLLTELTARNRVLETIREVLETLAGPVPLVDGLALALQSLRTGLQADEVGLFSRPPGAETVCRARVSSGGKTAGLPMALAATVETMLGAGGPNGRAQRLREGEEDWHMAVSFPAPVGPTVLLARWSGREMPPDSETLLEDAANSLRLALEREESERAHQEAAALRRSQQLQRQFLSRLSHELRTPLTAIRGYASSLTQPDVTWDRDSEERFLSRIAAESARVGRLVDDLLDFSAIESSVLRLHSDWCDLGLVLDAARACLQPSRAAQVDIRCHPDLPVVWADHDRLEQVFVNLLDNAFRHNRPGTAVCVEAEGVEGGGPGENTEAPDPTWVTVSVTDDGSGVAAGVAVVPLEAPRERRSPTAGAGLGLSIAKGIVDAHGGRIELERLTGGTRFVIHLPVERSDQTDDA